MKCLFKSPVSAGMLLPAGFLVAVAYAGCSHILTVTFLTLSTTTGGTSASGVFINQIDIAPRWVLQFLYGDLLPRIPK